ncbi:ABC transporter permease [Sedimenticola sp.]|uniref:ABC transporter permease n=1 Tax=Sedimenticola sp. TaxID=1940285 RepID=UPI00258C62F2|nr:ABC transporter permease [Sedimenticola sp.]MCW8905185.1 ABC transporter permease [Sedimenticola sp.]
MRGVSLQVTSLLLLLALWTLIALMTQTETLPTPWQVFLRIGGELNRGDLLSHCLITLGRVAAAFILAMAVGSAIGLYLGLHKTADRFFDPWLLVMLNLPALVVIILCYLWIGLNEVAAVLAVALNKIPNVAVTLREGAKALDRDLLEMARCYRLSRSTTLKAVIWPQLTPFIAAAARSGLALVWKIVLVVELLGRSNGVGFQLHLYFQLFDVTGILAYSLAFIVIIWGIEQGLIRPWERRVNRWRDA